ncbi:MAG: hypothetical protein ACLRNQ_11810 [Flavonifractor plautii]
MLTFTAMAWGGDAIDGVSLIDLRQKLKDITAQQALLRWIRCWNTWMTRSSMLSSRQ